MQSKQLLWLGLAITVGLSVWSQWQAPPDDEVELARPAAKAISKLQPQVKQSPAPQSSQPQAPTLPDNSHLAPEWQLRRGGADASQVNLFASSTPVAPTLVDGQPGTPGKKVKLPPPPPPPPPMAPPLPLRYLGRMQDGTVAQLFVSYNGDNLALKAGDVIGGSYRLDTIQNNRAVFTYIPLNQTQTMIFGEQP